MVEPYIFVVILLYYIPVCLGDQTSCYADSSSCWDGFNCFNTSNACITCTTCDQWHEQDDIYCYYFGDEVGVNPKLPLGTTFTPLPNVVSNKHYAIRRTSGYWGIYYYRSPPVNVTVICPTGYYAVVETVSCNDINRNMGSFWTGEYVDCCRDCYSYNTTIGIQCKMCGQWNATPACDRGCEPLSIVKGQVAFKTTGGIVAVPKNGVYNQSTVATVTCDSGFYLSTMTAFATTVCDDISNSGTWSVPHPTCLAGCANVGSLSNRGTTNYDESMFQNVYPAGTIASFNCPMGYYLEPQITSASCEGPLWSSALPLCQIGCPPLSVDNGGEIYGTATTINGVFKTATTATISCGDGYFLSTNTQETTVTCNSIGQWDNIPTCIFGCSAITDFLNGIISYLPSATVNNVYRNSTLASFTCASGYYLSTLKYTESLTCSSANAWKSVSFQCLSGCSKLSIENGAAAYTSNALNEVFIASTTATITCNSGYYPYNSSQTIATCNSEGCWANDTNLSIIHGSAIMTGTTGTLRNFKETIQFTCDKTFYLSSVLPASCEANGSWTNIPSCTPGCVNDAPTIENQFGDPNYNTTKNATWYPQYTTAEYTCISTYKLHNSTSSQCIKGNWTRPPICDAPETVLVVTKVLMGMSCTFLVVSLSIIIGVNLAIRDFSIESCLHMNEEVSLLIGHGLLLIFRDRVDLVNVCPLISMTLQYLFTASSVFKLLEALQFYCLLTNAISFGGVFQCYPNLKNCIVGWTVPLIPTLLTASWGYQYYPAFNSCWVNLGNHICVAIAAPMTFGFLTTVVLTEASQMGKHRRLPLTSRSQKFTSHINQKNMVPLAACSLLSWGLGVLAAYHSSATIFFIASVVNIIFGVSIIICHFVGNPKLNNWFLKKFGKKTTRGKSNAETNPPISVVQEEINVNQISLDDHFLIDSQEATKPSPF